MFPPPKVWEEALGELNILLKCTPAPLHHRTGCSAQCQGEGLLLGALAPQKCIEGPPGGSSAWPQGAAGCPLLPAVAQLAPPRRGPGATQHGLPGDAGGLPGVWGCPEGPCEHQEVLLSPRQRPHWLASPVPAALPPHAPPAPLD